MINQAKQEVQTAINEKRELLASKALEEKLALLENGHNRIGEQLVASAPIADQQVGVEVVSPHFFDPEGNRQYA